MIYIFKPKLALILDEQGQVVKLRVSRTASECQALCEAEVAPCAHGSEDGGGQFVISESLPGVSSADLPTGWSFGNGVTCGATVNVKGLGPTVLSWAVFPGALTPGQYAKLKTIMEED